MDTEPGPTPGADELTRQLADRDNQIAALQAQVAARDLRVRHVEQEYRKLQQAVGFAANELLAANHPLA